MNDIHGKIKMVEGWLKKEEVEILYFLAKNCKKGGAIVEIGSWKGKSTICLALGSKDGNKIIVNSIDHHTGSPEHRLIHKKVWTLDDFKKNITSAGINDLVRPIVKTSETAAQSFSEPINLIFIDADHSYEGIKNDFELWFPKVSEGGIMAFHDTTSWKGPSKAVNQLIFKSSFFRKPTVVRSITYAEKVSSLTPLERLDNYLRLMKKKLFLEKVLKYSPPKSTSL